MVRQFYAKTFIYIDYVRKIEPNKPKLCQMGAKGCSDIINTWTVGNAGQCAPKEFGYRIGMKGYKRVLLQVSICLDGSAAWCALLNNIKIV